MNGDYNPNWGTYNPYGPAVPTPCPTCNRCPTCGSYRPSISWTGTTYISNDTMLDAGVTLSQANQIVNTCPAPPDTDCSHD